MITYNFLLVDDEKEYCRTFATNAAQIGIDDYGADIIVRDCQNWEDAEEAMRTQHFHAVVLDAKCMIDRSQETEDFQFLAVALDRLSQIAADQDRYIPFAVNTGYIGEKEAQVMDRLITERRGRKFSKTSPKAELISYLVCAIQKSIATKIELRYPDVFEVFNRGYLDNSFRLRLLQVVQEMEKPSENANVLGLARVIQDGIYDELERRGIFSSGDFKPRKSPPSFGDKNHFLGGNFDSKRYTPTTAVFQTSTIRHLSEAIYRISSDYGNHAPPKKPSAVPVAYWEQPSNHAVKSVVFALMEQLCWLKELIENISPKTGT